MIRNLKTDLKSEFGGPNTAKERERCAGELARPSGQAWPSRVGAVGPTAREPLWSRVAHAPPTGMGDVATSDWPKNSLSLLLLNSQIPSISFSRRKA